MAASRIAGSVGGDGPGVWIAVIYACTMGEAGAVAGSLMVGEVNRSPGTTLGRVDRVFNLLR